MEFLRAGMTYGVTLICWEQIYLPLCKWLETQPSSATSVGVAVWLIAMASMIILGVIRGPESIKH